MPPTFAFLCLQAPFASVAAHAPRTSPSCFSGASRGSLGSSPPASQLSQLSRRARAPSAGRAGWTASGGASAARGAAGGFGGKAARSRRDDAQRDAAFLARSRGAKVRAPTRAAPQVEFEGMGEEEFEEAVAAATEAAKELARKDVGNAGVEKDGERGAEGKREKGNASSAVVAKAAVATAAGSKGVKEKVAVADCVSCGGSGWEWSCGECDAVGFTAVVTPEVPGSGAGEQVLWRTCEHCRGRGRAPCPVCSPEDPDEVITPPRK